MIEIGLMPSDTGMPGGKTTGQHMNDYPIANGKFITACKSLIESNKFELTWVDKYARESHTNVVDIEHYVEALEEFEEVISSQLTAEISELFEEDAFAEPDLAAAKKVKTRYSCESCNLNVWGKSGLGISCNVCELDLVEST